MSRLKASSLAAAVVMVTFVCPLSAQSKVDSPESLSPGYSRVALTALAQMHRWKEKARSDAKGNTPAPTFGAILKTSAREQVTQARLSAQTEGDKQASEALETLYTKLSQWTDKLVSARERLDATNAIDPDAVDKDDDLLQISDCEQTYHRMLQAGTYQDLPSCR